MGLIDILNGMAQGPHGTSQPNESAKGGMSKTGMAVLAFLAYKAYKNWTAQQAPAQTPASGRYPVDNRDERSVPRGGGIADILRTILGGGQPPGEVVSRGIGKTVDDLERTGHGEIARSWVSRGPNRPISQQQLQEALGEDGIRDLMQQTGMRRDELLAALSEHLPRVIDRLTPGGRVPTDQEAARMA